MGIRVIGVDLGVTGRIQQSPSGDGVTEPTISFKPVGEQYVIDEPNNDGESNPDGTGEFIDPASIASGDSGSSSGGTGKRRGRKPGSRNKSGGGASRASTSKTTDSIAAMLFTIHSVASAIVKVPALKIPKAGCQELAAALMEVTELYEIPLLSEKGMAWANLAAVATKVYIFDGKATVVKGTDRVHIVSEPVVVPEWMKSAGGRAQ